MCQKNRPKGKGGREGQAVYIAAAEADSEWVLTVATMSDPTDTSTWETPSYVKNFSEDGNNGVSALTIERAPLPALNQSTVSSIPLTSESDKSTKPPESSQELSLPERPKGLFSSVGLKSNPSGPLDGSPSGLLGYHLVCTGKHATAKGDPYAHDSYFFVLNSSSQRCTFDRLPDGAPFDGASARVRLRRGLVRSLTAQATPSLSARTRAWYSPGKETSFPLRDARCVSRWPPTRRRMSFGRSSRCSRRSGKAEDHRTMRKCRTWGASLRR